MNVRISTRAVIGKYYIEKDVLVLQSKEALTIFIASLTYFSFKERVHKEMNTLQMIEGNASTLFGMGGGNAS